MADPIRVEFDREGFKKIRDQFRPDRMTAMSLLAGGASGSAPGSANRFIAQVQVYLTAQMDRALRQFGGLKEGESADVRGVEWRGWAIRSRRAYGGTITESTRFRFRKFSRTEDQRQAVMQAFGSEAAGAYEDRGRTWKRAERRTMMATPIAERPYEQVWKVRASGALYDSSSKLMQDTGRLRASLHVVDTRIVGGAIEFRPGAGKPHYFDRQNELRPIWVLDKETDEPKLRAIAQESLDALARLITEGK